MKLLSLDKIFGKLSEQFEVILNQKIIEKTKKKDRF